GGLAVDGERARTHFQVLHHLVERLVLARPASTAFRCARFVAILLGRDRRARQQREGERTSRYAHESLHRSHLLGWGVLGSLAPIYGSRADEHIGLDGRNGRRTGAGFRGTGGVSRLKQ